MNKIKMIFPSLLAATMLLTISNAGAAGISAKSPLAEIKTENRQSYLIDVSSKNQPKKPAARTSGWSVKSDDDLEKVLKTWGARAGWKIIWKSDNAYHIAGSATFPDTFLGAVKKLMDAMGDARPAPIATIYTGNQTIVITDGLGETF